MQKITPCLWFDTQGEEAARFYVSIFKDARITQITHYGPDMPGREGTVMTVVFELLGQSYMALNGGPHFKFNEAISLMVSCETQAEIDYYWEKLSSEGGQEVECGWVKDKYGLSWQIIPSCLEQLLTADQARTNRVMRAVMSMKKLNIAEMQAAAEAE